MRTILQRIYDVLFPLPAVCPICLSKQHHLQVCAACQAEALRKRSLHGQCQRCHSFGLWSYGCSSCQKWPAYLCGNIAIWPYQDEWQQVILDFKFRNRPWLADALAQELVPVLPAGYDLLVPVPLHKNRLRERGYNQSELLVQALAEQSKLPWQKSLLRSRDTPHQTGLSRNQRLHNLDGAFTIDQKCQVNGKNILLVDDVFTSGTTLQECAQVLHQHGAKKIMGITLASGRGHFS